MSTEKAKENGRMSSNGSTSTSHNKDNAHISHLITLGLVFGGCCSNAWTLETLIMHDSSIGSALTFLQLSFVALYCLPSFLHRRNDVAYFKFLPRLDTPVVPLRTWAVQVLLLLAVNVFNNWTFVYKIPLTLQIIFRSSGLAVSMLFGYLFLEKRYSRQQLLAIFLVTCGVILATLSRPSAPSTSSTHRDNVTYIKGVIVMVLSLLLSGLLGMLQEKTYRAYGPVWKEGLFYTHALALPLYLFTASDIRQGLAALSHHAKLSNHAIPSLYIIVFINVITQACCVSGVNRLVSTVSSVQTSLLLTARKAVSLVVSIVWFGSGWSLMLAAGAGLVSIGTILYDWRPRKVEKEKTL